MKVLALDAALGGFPVALDDDGSVRSRATGRQDALERGLGIVAELLAEARIGLRDCDRIAVGLGPGSFTGVRIALAYAKSLAYASGLPLVGISSYDALEPDDPPLPILGVVRGRRGVVCARLREAYAAPAIGCGPTEQVLNQLLPSRAGTIHLVGNTEDVRSHIAERGWTVRALPPRAAVPAAAIAQLARIREPSPSPHALAPDYGEQPAVTAPKAHVVRAR